MGALTIAFDTIIVGALALPWVLLVIHLFFSSNEGGLQVVLDWVKQQNQPALAGVLLFAMTYPLGSAVSRLAQDSFDDGDLHIQFSDHFLLRQGITETSIRTDVYCHNQELLAQMRSDALTERRKRFKNNESCQYTARWIIPQNQYWIQQQQDLAAEIFYVQEATLLLKGTDATEKLRVFHDQIMVLRGAAFDGFVVFSLCLFWWCTRLPSWLRRMVPLAYFLPGALALYNHRIERPASDTPYMEFALLCLAGAAWYLLWPNTMKEKAVPEEAGEKRGPRGAYLVLSLFLTFAAFLGWWATQVLYDEQVIYSYKAISEVPAEQLAPNPR